MHACPKPDFIAARERKVLVAFETLHVPGLRDALHQGRQGSEGRDGTTELIFRTKLRVLRVKLCTFVIFAILV